MNDTPPRGYVVVTGSSTGIGRATALRLARRRFRVFAGVRLKKDAKPLTDAAGDRIIPLKMDVTKPEMIAECAAEVREVVGESGLAGLVNNAGISVPGPIEFLPLEELRRQLEVNVIGQVAVTQAFLPLLREGGGRIVFVGSIGGKVASPFVGAYNASKFALEAITDSLRVELRPWGIEVAIVEPGSVDTPIWEKVLAEADEIEARLPDEARELYGEAMDAMRAALREIAAGGIPPEEVARAISHALTSRRPKTRYLVGTSARVQSALAKVVPDRLRDRIIMRRVGLTDR
ncbi:MAG TPA: SDR family oxidoreductase [Dehalococcoidia bacterium]|nr:SDR family oxidoreductase [Dehalococcoidia bacterium]